MIIICKIFCWIENEYLARNENFCGTEKIIDLIFLSVGMGVADGVFMDWLLKTVFHRIFEVKLEVSSMDKAFEYRPRPGCRTDERNNNDQK